MATHSRRLSCPVDRTKGLDMTLGISPRLIAIENDPSTNWDLWGDESTIELCVVELRSINSRSLGVCGITRFERGILTLSSEQASHHNLYLPSTCLKIHLHICHSCVRRLRYTNHLQTATTRKVEYIFVLAFCVCAIVSKNITPSALHTLT